MCRERPRTLHHTSYPECLVEDSSRLDKAIKAAALAVAAVDNRPVVVLLVVEMEQAAESRVVATGEIGEAGVTAERLKQAVRN